MKELDLQDIWESDGEGARKHFESIPDPEEIAKKQSQQSLKKMKRNMINETLISVPIILAANVWFYFWDIYMFWGYLGVSIVATLISVYSFIRIRRSYNLVQGKDVMSSLEDYIQIFESVLRRTKVVIAVFTPLAMCLMMVLVVAQDMQDWELNKIIMILAFLLISGIITAISINLVMNKLYIPAVYGKHLDDLKQTLANLVNGNGNYKSNEDESPENQSTFFPNGKDAKFTG